jgi:Stress responsive A/B Barrel Domain
VTLHVVLFTPRSDVTDAERHTFGEALDLALTSIPSVRRYRVGRRVRTGAAYDALPGDYEFCAVIEFDDLAGLRGYLEHPAHVELGRLFYTTSGDAFAGDYEAVDTSPANALQHWHRDLN